MDDQQNISVYANAVGFKGWLNLTAILLAFSAVLGLYELIQAIPFLKEAMGLGIGVCICSLIAFFVNFAILIYLLIAVDRFFKKRKNAPQTVIRLIIIWLVTPLLLSALGLAIIGSIDKQVVIIAVIKRVLVAAIWIPYFKLSRRVKATFVN